MIEPFNYIKISNGVELVYADKTNNQYLFNTQVLSILPEKIMMAKPINNTEDFSIINNYDKLQLNFYTADGVFTSEVNFLEYVDIFCTDIFTSYPYNCNFIQRRNKKREALHVDCELNILIDNVVSDIIQFKTKNISEAGTACITKEPLCNFENAQLIIHFANVDITTFCQKIYSKEMELDGEIVFLNGIEFTNISKINERIINQEILKFQFEY